MNEERLSAIFARAQVGLSEAAPDGRFLRVNEALCQMLGRSHETLMSSGIADVTLAEDLPRSLEAFHRLMETGESVSLDKRYVRPDGTLVFGNTLLTRLDDEQGHPGTVLAVTIDLTAHKHAQEALAENVARFRALAEASPALVWQLAPGGRLVYINSRCITLLGKSPQELLDNGWETVLHPDDARAYVQAMAEAQRTRSPVVRRVRVKTRDRRWRWLESHASPWHTADDSYAGHVGISIDIDDVVRAQEELLISNERLNLAIEGSGDGVWDWDIAGNKTLYSKRMREIFDYAEYEGTSSKDGMEDWKNRVHPDDLSGVTAALQACLKGATPTFHHEYRIRSKNGSWKWIQARAVVVERDAHHNPLRLTGTVTDISAKRRSEEIIWHHANFDTLTGLPNRRLFRDRLDHEVKKAHRTGLPLALLFIDLDRFKEANDVLGHDVGDQLLLEAATRISACVRESDTVARLGGDEFTAILSELDDVAHVEMIAEKINLALASPFHLGNESVYLSGSIGITLYPNDADKAEDLIRNADQAMYGAKNAGRNQFSYFTQSMQQEAHDRMRLIGDLRVALARGQFKVYYQPVIDLTNDRVVKAEALLRWFHPMLGMIEPLRFIPFAEECGVINEIGDWVFKEAAACAQQWSRRLGAPFQISVNKSPVQFLSRTHEVDWPTHLSSLGLTGNSVSVEITEGLLLNASPGVAAKLLHYRDTGIQVAIDDFGTGYSSMAYLKRFDIDYLKIDQSFVRDMATNDGDRAIVRSVTVMAHELGLQVVAEGIETVRQKELLIEAGCDFGQGFLFSQALPPEEFERALMA
ncbi:MAG TPA: EAL domain-containing protein [Noviherbaspirillum sp.]|nr:EAL domain-containing protein [Noviherbaspirillum sp.]